MANVRGIVSKTRLDMVRNASPEFLACMAAGVDMETVSVYKSVTNTWEITMKTVRPVGFVRNCHNEITSVVVQGG